MNHKRILNLQNNSINCEETDRYIKASRGNGIFYTIITTQALTATTYLLLSTSIISLCVCKRNSSTPLMLLAISIILGIISARISFVALGLIILMGLACYCYFQQSLTFWARIIVGILITILSIGLMSHKLLGFNNWNIVPQITFSKYSSPYSLWLNFDKPIVGFFIFLFGSTRLRDKREWKEVAGATLPIIVLAVVTIIPLAMTLSYVKLDPKLPSITLLWIAKTLLFTYVPEEASFRLFLQQVLSDWLKQYRFGSTITLVIVSILFGLIHFAGGMPYVMLATIAGFFYGLAYARTGRVEASIAVHFTVNLIHFIFFSYP